MDQSDSNWLCPDVFQCQIKKSGGNWGIGLGSGNGGGGGSVGDDFCK